MIIICTLVLLLAACSDEIEENIIFYDTYLQQTVIKDLTERNVKFRLENGNSLWFSHNDSETVEYIYSQAVSNRPIRYGFYDSQKYLLFISLLEEEGIIITSEAMDSDNSIVWVPIEARESASIMFHQVITNAE